MSEEQVKLGEPTEGDMWASLNAMWREVARLREEMRTLSERVKNLQAAQMRGAIEGLEGEWTVTPPPEFGAA